uniref:PH domain-containing protein n=1 Tax=Plectus sambesii TaxID=2011161 RepID=A0A914VC54_9BILA
MSGGGDSKKTKSGGSSKTGILRSLSFQFTTFRGNSASKDANGSAVRDSIAESCPTLQRQESLGPIAGVQCHGLMLKKHKRKNRGAKWNKRFFVLKESFLLYYAPRYQKVFGKTKIIDLHPKGLVPLGGCSVVSGGDIGKKHCLLITHEEFKTPIILCAADFKTQEKWLLALREATKV